MIAPVLVPIGNLANHLMKTPLFFDELLDPQIIKHMKAFGKNAEKIAEAGGPAKASKELLIESGKLV